MHSLSGLTPSVASARLPVLPLLDSKMIYYSFTLQGNRHTHTLLPHWCTHTSSLHRLLKARVFSIHFVSSARFTPELFMHFFRPAPDFVTFDTS